MAVFDPVIDEQTPAADFTIAQKWDRYTAEEHAAWDTLYARQVEITRERSVKEFRTGLGLLDLGSGGIPDLDVINPKLKALTGWEVVMVPHLVPDEVFFTHLANRRFPAGRFIRKPTQLDYLEEPDIFHDIFGHVPMLTLPVFANYMQAYGRGGLRAKSLGRLKELARLYWYTVEFGLIQRPSGLKIYGAGIVSSAGETPFSLDSPSPNRIGFDLERVMRTDYIIDDYQQLYVVIESFEQLLGATQQDFGPIYDRLSADETRYTVTDLIEDDQIITRGTQAYAAAKAG
ncbi:phenylalanine-4-hydroxylase [Algimonas arctica]|uniref:Phenylalanine-4-hydroxylase n=1 Tax=Algimonas arctica TaxID=1479486 RepID=A0A8J3CR93_9PROT|nr:phenylalanine 4-monooxygenase [Algimonas arctica]GHA97564.1 phenylalanine-4-hydroxylase [Algimonas arctica]